MESILNWFSEWFAELAHKIDICLISNKGWILILKGLGVTLEVAFFAALLGIVVGLIVALMTMTKYKRGRNTLLSRIAHVYITVIRGTPSVIQLLIVYFVIFQSVNISAVLAGIIAFALNSGAYVAEIFRSGILSIDNGQMEAGRSLGLNYNQTMFKIIMPQAIKNILPALGNEFIVLLKETAILGMIAGTDLTKAADFIQSRTLEPFVPLLTAALIYLVLVMLMQKGLSIMEKELRKSDNR